MLTQFTHAYMCHKREMSLKCGYYVQHIHVSRFTLPASQTTIQYTMKRHVIYILFCVPTTTRSHVNCEEYYFANSLCGQYCPTEGITTPNVSWDHCKLFCLHTESCQAINYNFTAGLCIYFFATCPKAISHPIMAFGLFTGRQPHQCLDWIPKENGHQPGYRSVTEDNVRFTATMQKDGNDYVCYLLKRGDACLSLGNEEKRFKASHGPYPCEVLQIREGCTVLYVDYDIGAPLPPTALIGGYTATGLPVYIGRRGLGAGYYIPGSNRLVVGYHSVTNDVKLLVLL